MYELIKSLYQLYIDSGLNATIIIILSACIFFLVKNYVKKKITRIDIIEKDLAEIKEDVTIIAAQITGQMSFSKTLHEHKTILAVHGERIDNIEKIIDRRKLDIDVKNDRRE